MYIACCQGKIPLKNIYELEDVLTSNVFSFFKYADRNVFLRSLFEDLSKQIVGLSVSRQNLNEAEFIFWPKFDTNYKYICNDIDNEENTNMKADDDVFITEPDLVVIIGEYYILIEAKLNSNFHKETSEKESQLVREIKGGKKEAESRGLKFKLLTITKHYYFDKEAIYKESDATEYIDEIAWINWQRITEIIDDCLKNDNLRIEDKVFASDLIELLCKQKLRSFYGWNFANDLEMEVDFSHPIFFKISIPIPIEERILENRLIKRKAKSGQYSLNDGLLYAFWISLLDSAKSSTNLHLHAKASDRTCVGVRVKRFLQFNYILLNSGARVELYIASGDKKKNKDIFDKLKMRKREIEELFGGDLKWERLDEKDACRISKSLDIGSYRERGRWIEIQKGMIEVMVRLEHSLEKHIDELGII